MTPEYADKVFNRITWEDARERIPEDYAGRKSTYRARLETLYGPTTGAIDLEALIY